MALSTLHTFGWHAHVHRSTDYSEQQTCPRMIHMATQASCYLASYLRTILQITTKRIRNPFIWLNYNKKVNLAAIRRAVAAKDGCTEDGRADGRMDVPLDLPSLMSRSTSSLTSFAFRRLLTAA